jgi:hypothetical protein
MIYEPQQNENIIQTLGRYFLNAYSLFFIAVGLSTLIFIFELGSAYVDVTAFSISAGAWIFAIGFAISKNEQYPRVLKLIPIGLLLPILIISQGGFAEFLTDTNQVSSITESPVNDIASLLINASPFVGLLLLIPGFLNEKASESIQTSRERRSEARLN